MQRRVSLARAIAARPHLLLLDEPFVSLDSTLVGDMRDLLASLLATSSATTLLVSHTPEDAARLADRAIVLNGRPATIARDLAFPIPRHQRDAATVAAYIGDLQ
jgi:ABC-type nitrate/sulfonate/bicarbonate transport system ATPase subunit